MKHLDDSCPAQAQTPSRFRPVLYFVGVKHGLELVSTGLPFIDSANQRVNIMMQQNKAGDIVVSVCDPHIGLSKTTGQGHHSNNESAAREIRIMFDRTIKLVSSTSGLPQANPPLSAKVIGDKKNTLSFQTANGVTDTFVISLDH